jgi:hypothetical protein
MSETVYAVVEMVAQSRDTERTDLANEDVLTFPVVGVEDDRGEAESLADGDDYEVVPVPEDWF